MVYLRYPAHAEVGREIDERVLNPTWDPTRGLHSVTHSLVVFPPGC